MTAITSTFPVDQSGNEVSHFGEQFSAKGCMTETCFCLLEVSMSVELLNKDNEMKCVEDNQNM